MKFMVTWRVHDEQRHEVLKYFGGQTAEDQAAELDGLNLIGRWHEPVSLTGVAICEADDPAAVANWLLNWNHVCDIEVVPVFDDDETRAIARARG